VRPVSLARHILEDPARVRHRGGPTKLARQAGLELCDPSFFITPRESRGSSASSRSAAIRRTEEPSARRGRSGARGRHLDRRRAGRDSGPRGDTPIIGAGTFADDRAERHRPVGART
jgi:beta-aspartyl-peptidase (threonine type)